MNRLTKAMAIVMGLVSGLSIGNLMHAASPLGSRQGSMGSAMSHQSSFAEADDRPRVFSMAEQQRLLAESRARRAERARGRDERGVSRESKAQEFEMYQGSITARRAEAIAAHRNTLDKTLAIIDNHMTSTLQSLDQTNAILYQYQDIVNKQIFGLNAELRDVEKDRTLDDAERDAIIVDYKKLLQRYQNLNKAWMADVADLQANQENVLTHAQELRVVEQAAGKLRARTQSMLDAQRGGAE